MTQQGLFGLDAKGCFDRVLTKEQKREFLLLAMTRRGFKRNNIQVYSAEEVIETAFRDCGDDLTLGWSGGKCSTIVLHLVLQRKPDIRVIYNNTGVEFPENVQYVHDVAKLWNVNLVQLRPETTFWKIVKEHGFPQIQSRTFKGKRQSWNNNSDKKPMCCYRLKEKPRFTYYRTHQVKGDLGGLRAGESRTRAIHFGRRGQFYTIKRPYVMTVYHPIALWTTEECERYIAENNIPFNHTYDTQTRNGCWPCTAYKSWKRNIMRYNPRMYKLVQNMQGNQLISQFLEQEVI